MLNLTASCATVKAPDVPVCVETSLERGRCTKTISDVDLVIDEQNPYNGQTWWQLRPTLIMMPYPAWVELKTFVIKICKKKLANCDDSVANWDRKFESIDEKVRAKN